MQQRGVRTVFILVLNVFLFSLSAYAGGKEVEWMKALHDTLSVCKISIPGSHDSGTTKGGSMLKTQSSDISSQLQQGIRAFDIRLQKRDGKLGIYHSHAFQDIYWEDYVLPAFINFLKNHPSETIIVSLKKEGGELKDYAALLSTSISTPAYQSYFIETFLPELTLKDCRGKILFLHRDHAMDNYPGATCIGWKDDASCELILRNNKGQDGFVLLQDEYQYKSGSDNEADKKLNACIRNFEKIANEPVSSRRWGISFISATGYPSGTPFTFADKVNRPIADYLGKAQRKQNYGIVFIDFVNAPDGKKLVKHLIDSNFALIP